MVTGNPAEVEKSVRRLLEIMKPGGGYMLAPTHNWQDDAPSENVIAVYETAKKYGVY